MSDDITPCFVGQAARVLEVGEGTVRRWADEGKLQHWRTAAGLRVFNLAALQRLAAERREKAAK